MMGNIPSLFPNFRVIGRDLPDPTEPATFDEIQAAIGWYDNALEGNLTQLNKARAGGYIQRSAQLMSEQKRLQTERQIWRDSVRYAIHSRGPVAVPFNNFALSRGIGQ